MFTDSLIDFKNFLHAHLCYQVFITPLHLPIKKQYREFARLACDYLQNERSEVLHFEFPRHHVIHHFTQNNKNAKKVLIVHGWMSRAAYMARLIRALHQQGFEVYALDFPAHGEARGIQLPWTDAVAILNHTLKHLGPFYAVIGHSFGGSMVLNTLSLAKQYSAWKIKKEPEKVVFLASPTHMRAPVNHLARQLKLTGKGYLFLRQVFCQHSEIELKSLHLRNFIIAAETPILCVHGREDKAIQPQESITFCQQYPHATLSLLPGVDHVGLLLDARVESEVCNFLNQ